MPARAPPPAVGAPMVVAGNRRLWLGLLLVMIGLTVTRLFLAGRTELIPEEAYYWTYAQHPALGYFDHPPLVAWAVRAGTLVFGDTELGVRFVNFLAWIATCFLLLATGKAWFSERVALAGTLLFAILPISVGIGFLVTPDAVLILCWTLTLFAVSRAVQTQCGRYWALAGLGFGGAMLAKYYALVLLPSLLIFLAVSPRYRFWLKKPQPWLAGLLALAVFSPVIIWNAQHDWASFAFQSTRTIGQSGAVVRRVGMFWLYQLLMSTPVGLAVLAVAAGRAVRRGWRGDRADNWNFVAAFGLPVFGLFAVASVKTNIHINWTAPAFLALALGGGAVWGEAVEARRRGWVTGTWVLLVLCGAAAIFGHVRLATGHPAKVAYANDNGWRELAVQVRAAAPATGGQPFFIGMDKYNIAAELGFYLQQPAECVNGYATGAQGLGYRYWTDLRRYVGRPAVIVFAGKLPVGLGKYFSRLSDPVRLRVDSHGREWKAVVGFDYRASLD